jgi:hypothetical protein
MNNFVLAGISALRAFRVLRIIRMIKSARNIRRVIRTLVRSMQEAAHLMIVLSIVLFTFALVGMQFFGGKMCAERACEYPDDIKVRNYIIMTQLIKHEPPFDQNNPAVSTRHHQRQAITRSIGKEIVEDATYLSWGFLVKGRCRFFLLNDQSDDQSDDRPENILQKMANRMTALRIFSKK